MYDLSRYYDDSKREGQAIERVTLEDYNGEVCHIFSPSWIYMYKVGYKLTMSDTFMMFLEQLNKTEGGIL